MLSGMQRESAQRVSGCVTALLRRQPFFGSLALRLPLKPDPNRETLAADGRHIRYSSLWVAESDAHAIETAIARVVMACALKHHTRRGGRDAERWQLASQLVTHALLRDAGFALPPGAEAWDGMSVEEAYDRLPEPRENDPDGDGDTPPAGGSTSAAAACEGGDDDPGSSDAGDGQGDGNPADDGEGENDRDDDGPSDAPPSHDPSGTGEIMDANTRGEGDAGELSLAENVVRIAMHPADQVVAFSALAQAGATVGAIAARFGVPERTVEQRLRLGNAAPELLDAYRADGIDLDTLKAFAVTTDHERQRSVWEQVSAQGYRPSAWQVRRLLTEKRVPAGSPMARFVGVDAYEAAGGAVLRDLFADEHENGVWLEDPALLVDLAMKKLAAAADELSTRWKWAEAMVEVDWSATARFGRIHPEPGEPTDGEAAEIGRLRARHGELSDMDEDDWTEELAGEAETVEARLDAIEAQVGARALFKPEDFAMSGPVQKRRHLAEVLRAPFYVPHSPSEQSYKAEFAGRALVVVELRVGPAHLVHHTELGAEAHQREGAVVDRGAGAPCPVLACAVVRHMRKPAWFVVGPAMVTTAAHGEAGGQGHRDARADTKALVALARLIGAVAAIAEREIGAHRGRDNVGAAERNVARRSVEARAGAVVPVLPGEAPVHRRARCKPTGNLDARTKGVLFLHSAGPALARCGQHACLRAWIEQDAGPKVEGQRGFVEVRTRMLPAPDVGARPESSRGAHRVLVFATAPSHEADARCREFLCVALEGQAVNVDGALV